MPALHYTATSVAFALVLIELQKTRGSENFTSLKNLPLIAFWIALGISLPSTFISLFSEQDGMMRLVMSEFNQLPSISLGICILTICFSITRKLTDVGTVLLLLSAVGVFFFYIVIMSFAKKMEEHSERIKELPVTELLPSRE